MEGHQHYFKRWLVDGSLLVVILSFTLRNCYFTTFTEIAGSNCSKAEKVASQKSFSSYPIAVKPKEVDYIITTIEKQEAVVMAKLSSLDYFELMQLKRKYFPKVFTEVQQEVKVFTKQEYFTNCQSSQIKAFLYLIVTIAAMEPKHLLST